MRLSSIFMAHIDVGRCCPNIFVRCFVEQFFFLEECLMAKRLDQHTHIFADRSLDDDIMAESLVTKDEHCTNK